MEATISNPRVNEQIRVSPVRLIGADGEQVGIVALDDARERAQATGLDLVEVAADAKPPVVRLLDWGKYQYEQQKAAKEARKNAQRVQTKQVQLRPNTEEHDLQVVLRKARSFIEKGNSVRVVLRFRGRELRQPQVGHDVLDRVEREMAEVAEVAHRSRSIEGRQLLLVLDPAS